nr:spidroin-2 [Camelus dromedarius]
MPMLLAQGFHFEQQGFGAGVLKLERASEPIRGARSEGGIEWERPGPSLSLILPSFRRAKLFPGQATITTIPIGPSGSHIVARRRRRPGRHRRGLREETRAGGGRAAAGVGEGGREERKEGEGNPGGGGGGEEEEERAASRSWRGEWECGTTDRPGCHGRGRAARRGAGARRFLNPGGRGGGGQADRGAARGAGRRTNGEEGLGGPGQGEPEPARGRRGAAAAAAAERPGWRRRGGDPGAGPGWGGRRVPRVHPARARVQRAKGRSATGQEIPRSHRQNTTGHAGAEGAAASCRGSERDSRGPPRPGPPTPVSPVGERESKKVEAIDRLLQQPGSLPAAG